MIKIENTEIIGWEAAIRGMRNGGTMITYIRGILEGMEEVLNGEES